MIFSSDDNRSMVIIQTLDRYGNALSRCTDSRIESSVITALNFDEGIDREFDSMPERT